MTELEEFYMAIQLKIAQLEREQADRWAKSILTVSAFLSLDREEEWTMRMKQLIDAKEAIEIILGR